MSSQPPPENDPHAASLLGLPQRGNSPGRDRLEIIASEYLDALRSGGPPDVESWAARYPSLAEELREFLPLVAAMEDWKAHQDLRAVQSPLPEQFSLTQLGEYQILREIGRGGMGVVFEAEQPSLDRQVAIKMFPWRIPKRSTWAERFVREAHVAAQLQHAHIVPIYNFGEQDDRYYYVMQLIQGVGLDVLIARWRETSAAVCLDDLVREFHPEWKRRPQRQAPRVLLQDNWLQLVKISAQVASALRFAHRQGTLHRDIKPANLLIDADGTVRITDFGLAVGRDHQQEEILSGTVRYMAPEQFHGEDSQRSDIYSLGTTLYELFTAQPAFAADSRRQLIEKIQHARFRRPRQLRPTLPASVERIILKAMSLRPEDRYETVDLLHEDLLAALRQLLRGRMGLWNRLRDWF